MRDLTITEQYVLTVINKKGALMNVNKEFVVSAMIMDLKYEEFINVDVNENVSIKQELTDEFRYLNEIHTFIKTSGSISLKKLKLKFSGRALYANKNKYGINELKIKMLKDDLIQQVDYKNKYVANKEVLANVVESLRANILEDEDLDDKTMSLLTLLRNTKSVNLYFSAFEKEKLKIRTQTLSKSNVLFFKDKSRVAFATMGLSGYVGVMVGMRAPNICFSFSYCCANSILSLLTYAVVLGAVVGLFGGYIRTKNIW